MRLLGRGGMGEVWLARDHDLGREVALKLLSSAGGARLERFQREAALTAQLTHPGIVRVHASGVVNERPYLVYELVEGARSLDRALEGLELPARVSLIRDAARALGQAHAHGVIHRDVKPDNLLVDVDGRLRVADFGLALASDDDRLTKTGAVLGTPAYMAPEQVRANRGAQGAATDVWGLGVVLYEAASGSLPFPAQDLGTLFRTILEGAPKPLPGAAGGLEAVCRRALAKRPEDRHPDGEALARDLDTWLARAGGAGRGPRAVWVLPLVVAALLGGLLLYATWSGAPDSASEVTPPEPPAQPATAAEPWSNVLAIRPAEARAPRAWEWLRRHPGHPHAPDARELLRRYWPGKLVEISVASPKQWVQVAFAGEGETLELVTLAQGSVRRWGLSGEPKGEVTRQTRSGAGDLLRVPGGDLIAGSENGGVTRFSLEEGVRWSLPKVQCRRMSVSPDGAWVALSWARDKPLLVYDAARGEQVAELAGGAGYVRGVNFTLDGKHLLGIWGLHTGDGQLGQGEVRVWSVGEWKQTNHVRLRFKPRNAKVVGERLVIGNEAGQVWSFALDDAGSPGTSPTLFVRDDAEESSGLLFKSVKGSFVDDVVGLPAGSKTFTASADTEGTWGDVRCWTDDPTEALPALDFEDRAPRTLDLSPDGELLAVGTYDGRALIYWVGE